jgi:Tol biopolymer transport system component
VNRTSDHPGDDRFPAWSPDGLQIAFWSHRDGGGYFVMPAIGGTPRKVISTTGAAAADLSRPQWSPDGRELATVAYDNGQAYLEVVPLRAGEPRRFPLPVRRKALDISWSPDGSRLAYVDAVNLSSQVSQLGILDLPSGNVIVVTDGRDCVWSPHWSPDGEALLYVSNRRGSMDLWEQRLRDDGTPHDPARPLSSGIGMIRAVLSPDGTRLAYSRGQRVANLWQVPILPDRPATWADANQMTFDQAFIEFVDVSADGQHLLIASDRAGNSDVWMLPAAGGDMQQMTTGSAPEWAPRWSPDGQSIVFYSYENGNRDIWLMAAAGGPARQLTESEAADFVPAWSPDGERIAFTSLRSGNPDIWVTPSNGGQPVQLTEHPGEDRRPHWSSDGKWLAFVSSRSGELRVWRIPADGGQPEPVTGGAAYYPRWSPDGEQIYFTGWADRSGNLWEVSLQTGVERAVTDLSGRRGSIGDLALATDGDYLYFTWEEDIGNIWVMDVVTGESN